MSRVFGRLSVRLRVAVLTLVVSAATLGALGWWYVSRAETSYTRAVATQGLSFALQAAPTIAQLSTTEEPATLPLSSDGISAIGVFAADGSLVWAPSDDSGTLRRFGAEARRVARTGKPVQFLVHPSGERATRLRASDSPEVLEVTIVPTEGGPVATTFHARWAVDELRELRRVSIIVLAGGCLVLTLTLVLAITGLVTRRIERLAATDGLTGVANQRAFALALEEAVDEARVHATPLSLIAIDLDDLKRVNDEQGHQSGDRLIKSVATALRASTRATDICARVGGDEFSVLCPGLDRLATRAIVARIESALDAAGASASVGVAELTAGGTGAGLMHRADTAMYAVKARRKAAAAAA